MKVSELPKISAGSTNEAAISEYMQVLRRTHEGIGQELLPERLKKKAEERKLKKAKNVNIVKQNLEGNINKHPIRKKIQEMRKSRIFPQPKSYTNYRIRNGLVSKNSIKIKP